MTGSFQSFCSLVLELPSELKGSACLPKAGITIHMSHSALLLMWLAETEILVFMVAQQVTLETELLHPP